jgi:hypothetical protein
MYGLAYHPGGGDVPKPFLKRKPNEISKSISWFKVFTSTGMRIRDESRREARVGGARV